MIVEQLVGRRFVLRESPSALSHPEMKGKRKIETPACQSVQGVPGTCSTTVSRVFVGKGGVTFKIGAHQLHEGFATSCTSTAPWMSEMLSPCVSIIDGDRVASLCRSHPPAVFSQGGRFARNNAVLAVGAGHFDFYAADVNSVPWRVYATASVMCAHPGAQLGEPSTAFCPGLGLRLPGEIALHSPQTIFAKELPIDPRHACGPCPAPANTCP